VLVVGVLPSLGQEAVVPEDGAVVETGGREGGRERKEKVMVRQIEI